MSAPDAAAIVLEAWRSAWALPPDLLVSAWSDRFRYLLTSSTPFPGRWSTARTPYLRRIMDALSANDPAEWVICQKGAQVGVTEVLLNWLGYCMHLDPSALLLVLPSLSFARKYSNRRIQTMIHDCPAVCSRVAEERSRARKNTALYKEFAGGSLTIAGANSPISLGSDPVGRIAFDELDRFKEQVGSHGSPVALAEGRATMFPIRKFLAISTPTVRDESEIEDLYRTSDQQHFHVRCPQCGRFDFLTWSGYRDFARRADEGHHWIHWREDMPETAHMICGDKDCAHATEEGHKGELLAGGDWVATEGAGDGTRRGFHLPGLLSPPGAFSWGKAAKQFLERRHDPPSFRVWVNEVLGETWEETPQTIEVSTILKRCEPYPEPPREIPRGVGLLVAAADTQDDRLDYLAVGFGAAEESWVIEFGSLDGDPGIVAGSPEEPSVWQRLEAIRRKRWLHASGRVMRIKALAVDTGGHHSDEAYAYCRKHAGRGVLAIRGGNDPTAPLTGVSGTKNQGKVRLYTLGVDAGKDIIWSRLKITTPGPGFIHLPKDRSWTEGPGGEAFVEQLLSERKRRVIVRGKKTRRWVERRANAPNHAFDLMNYCLAALRLLSPAWTSTLAARAKALEEAPLEPPTAPVEGMAPPVPRPEPPRPRRGLPSGRSGGGLRRGSRDRF